jgi:8-oxo-dGTP pyrophosphatase MutT (NUDIX family)
MNKELHRITSTAIIVKDSSIGSGQAKYLITRRNLEKKVFPGKWTVPGGGLETNDYVNLPKTTHDHWYLAIEKSLRREIKEEVNLEVRRLNYLLDIAFIRPDKIPVVILSFWAFYKSGKIKLDEDSIDYQWVTLKEAKKYDLVEGLYGEIEMVEKLLKGADKKKVKYRNNIKL